MTPIQLTRLFGLKRTLPLSAKRLPSLRPLLADLDEDSIDFETLRRLPVMGKPLFRQQCEEWLANNAELPDYFISSGGTTGKPSVAWGYLPRMSERLPQLANGALRPLAIHSTPGRQGGIPYFPSHNGTLAVPLRDASGYQICLELLQREFDFRGYERRVSIAMLPMPAAKKLAHLMLLKGLSAADLALKELHTYSSYLSTRWRQQLQSVLGAKVIDHYGFSEMMEAKAAECRHCGRFHFGEQQLWELLDSAGKAVTQVGKVGHLVVTRLLEEDDKAQPMLRYGTGDLCELGPVCSAAGEPGFRPIGKQEHCLHLRTPGGVDLYPVRYSAILEALDTSALVARIANTRHSMVTPTEGESFAKWRLLPQGEPAAGNASAVLQVEMNFEPRLFTAEWQAFEEGLRRHLSASTADWGAAEQQMGFQLATVGLPPGSLRDAEVMRS